MKHHINTDSPGTFRILAAHAKLKSRLVLEPESEEAHTEGADE